LTCSTRSILAGTSRSGCKRPSGKTITGNCWWGRRRSSRRTTPTCRSWSPCRPCVPTILRDSVNLYLAARAALLLVTHGTFTRGAYAGERIADYVDSIAFPGLGTGVGRVGPNTCARQVRAAIDAALLGREVFPVSWVDAQHRHQGLYTDRVRDLQQE